MVESDELMDLLCSRSPFGGLLLIGPCEVLALTNQSQFPARGPILSHPFVIRRDSQHPTLDVRRASFQRTFHSSVKSPDVMMGYRQVHEIG